MSSKNQIRLQQEYRVGCPRLAPDDWELIIKPFDRSFPTGQIPQTAPNVYTESGQNAYYILPTEFEDINQKFAMAFALAQNNYGYWRPYLKYLPHENFCPQLDEDALVEFNDYRPGETFEQIAYPDGCLQGNAHSITVQTQLCDEPLTGISNVLVGSESQINEQYGLFVFWERKGNGEIFAVYSCDSIAFNHTNTSVPNEAHLNLTEDYIILQNSSMFDILFEDENSTLFYKTVQYEKFCPYLDPNLNLANATNQTLLELFDNSECTSQGDYGIHYSGKACLKPAQEADFSLSDDTLSYTGKLVDFTFLTKTDDSSTSLNVFYSCDGGVLYQSLLFEKKELKQSKTTYIIIGAIAGVLVLVGIVAGIYCCFKNSPNQSAANGP